MSREVRSAWPEAALAAVGFHPRDAARLGPLLPPAKPHVIATMVNLANQGRQYGSPRTPVAWVLWASQDITLDQARRVADCGREVIDLLVILDAVRQHVSHKLSVSGTDVAVEWAIDRIVPRSRIALYIELGLSPV